MKVRVRELGMEANTYRTAKGNAYTFFRGQWLEITDPEDIEFFKNDDRFEVETVAEQIKEKVTRARKPTKRGEEQ